MHEQAAHNLGLRCHYQLIEVAGADREELRALLDGVRRLGFAGVNITFPCKEAVVDLLDELSPDAAKIGAVNTIVVRDNRLIGYNTDTTGFGRAAANMVADSKRGSVTVIGAGGVGKACSTLFSRFVVRHGLLRNRFAGLAGCHRNRRQGRWFRHSLCPAR
jgi:shikimate dehydrogenase